MKTKICTKCGIEKDINDFYSKYYECKKCYAIYRKKYRSKNREKVLKQKKEYRKRNKKNINEYRQKRRNQLADEYIKCLLTGKNSLVYGDIPQELIELKRLEILLKRELKNVSKKY